MCCEMGAAVVADLDLDLLELLAVLPGAPRNPTFAAVNATIS